MKLSKYALPLLLCFSGVGAFSAAAATPEQMDQAKAIAYKYCLRYMNNGSGYLDDVKPSSTAALNKSLKAKEQENLKTLQKIALPSESEYSKWGKEEFNKFWKETFFDNGALKFNAKNACRAKAAGEIASIKVTAVEKPKAEEPKPTEVKPEPAAEVAEPAPVEASPAEAAPAADPMMASLVDAPVVDTAVEAVEIDVEDIKAETAKEEKSSNTSAIVILCVLVLVVVALVAYALNVMKRNKSRQERPASRRGSRRDDYEDEEEDERDDERYAPRRQASRQPVERATYTVESDPEEESPFAAYSAFTEEPAPRVAESTVRRQPRTERDREIEQLRAEVAALRSQLADTPTRRPANGARYTPGSRTQGPAHVIYLAQANADGVFTRADAGYNPGNSIFKLVTTDGVSGSFSVIDEPTVHELALMMPSDFLVNACVGRNLQQTHGARSIINETAGTALFEDGRWYVTRKARIRYSR